MLDLHPLKKKIIASISEMDMRMLDTLLPEDARYENTYKEVWLGKLGEFFTAIKEKGDTKLTVYESECPGRLDCACGLKVWLFFAPMSVKGFAIDIQMDSDEITCIERCYGNHLNAEVVGDSSEMLAFEAFNIYDNERIGFIESPEYLDLKKGIKIFIRDITKTNRKFITPVGINRKFNKYNALYFEALALPYFIKNKIDMLKIFDDLYSIKNILTQPKSYLYVLKKYQALRDSHDQKSKMKVLKWILMNQKKVSLYLVEHHTLTQWKGKLQYVYKIDDVRYNLEIRHPKVAMDVGDCLQFQKNVMLLVDFFNSKYIEEKKEFPYIHEQGILYHQFKDRLVPLMAEFEDWAKGKVV